MKREAFAPSLRRLFIHASGAPSLCTQSMTSYIFAAGAKAGSTVIHPVRMNISYLTEQDTVLHVELIQYWYDSKEQECQLGLSACEERVQETANTVSLGDRNRA